MLYTNEELSKKIKNRKKVKYITNILIYIIVFPLLIYNISLIIQALVDSSKTPSFLGIKTYVIISGSMRPEIEIGDIVVAKNVSEDELNVGDIICFRQGQSVITHRISGIVEENGKKRYKTKGDNNNTEDSDTTTINLIEGKVVKKIAYLGKISLVLQDKIAIVIIVLSFFTYLMHRNRMNQKKDERNLKRLKYENSKER